MIKMRNILIFAGTTEGRKLTEALLAAGRADQRIFVCVATEHGKHLLPKDSGHVTVFAQRLSEEEMETLMKKEGISIVVDATHPYAAEVSSNIKKAAGRIGIKYIRLLREQTQIGNQHRVVESAKAAADFLKTVTGKALLTTGSKELACFTDIQDYKNRIYPRILPTPEMVGKAFELGFDASHLICMQGPFSYEMNRAMLLQTGAEYLITKESGSAGGFAEKLAAAEDAGANVIIIGRPKKEEGHTLEEVLQRLDVKKTEEKRAVWFPMFTDIKDKRIVVVGAGKIAGRRIRTLVQFECSLIVIAPEAETFVEDFLQRGLLDYQRKEYEETDLADADLVLAATGDRELNRSIGLYCKEHGITVNVADRKEECDFYFPAIVQHGDLIAGITAGGKDHGLVVRGKKLIKQGLENGLDR